MDETPSGVRHFFKHISTEEGVYGLILVSGLIAAAGISRTPTGKILLFVGVTLVVFWLAHVYSGVVAGHGRRDSDGNRLGLSTVIRNAIAKTQGMLLSAVIPAAFLVLGTIGVLDNKTAIWASLWACVAVLGVLGYVSYHKLGVSMIWRIVGALSTASFGLVIAFVKYIVTH